MFDSHSEHVALHFDYELNGFCCQMTAVLGYHEEWCSEVGEQGARNKLRLTASVPTAVSCRDAVLSTSNKDWGGFSESSPRVVMLRGVFVPHGISFWFKLPFVSNCNLPTSSALRHVPLSHPSISNQIWFPRLLLLLLWIICASQFERK